MFCGNCGAKNEDGVKFCAECGTAMETAEQEVADAAVVVGGEPAEAETAVVEQEVVAESAPQESAAESAPVAAPVAVEEPVQKEKILGKKGRGGAIAIIAGAAVLLIGLIVAAILLLPRLFGAPLMCVYLTEDNELMYINKFNGKGEAKEITDEYVDEVYFTEDGKYIYYSEDKKDTLYVIKTSEIGGKKVKPEKIASDAWIVGITEKNELIYEKDDGSVHVYDGKDSYKLVKESGYGSYSEKDGFYYYTIWEDGATSLYRIKVDEDAKKEKLLEDAYSIHSAYNADTLVYTECNDDGTYTVLSAKRGEKAEKILKNLENAPVDVQVNGDELTIYYYENEEVEYCLYDFVIDDLRESDKYITEPSTSDYQKYTYSYWSGYYWTTDWDAYYEAYDEWYYKVHRDELRVELEEYEYTREYKNLHCYKNGTDTVIAQDVGSSWGRYDSALFYFKDVRVAEPVVNIVDIWSAYDVTYYLDFTGDVLYYTLNGVESEFEDADKFAAFDSYGYGLTVYSISDTELAMLDHSNYYDSGECPLWVYTIKNNKLTDGEKLVNKTFDATVGTYEGTTGLFFYDNHKDKNDSSTEGDLIFYANGECTEVAEDTDWVRIMSDSGLVVKSCDRKNGEFTLCIVEDGDETEVADDVQSIRILKSDDIIYIAGDDLHYWNGKDSVRIAKDVQDLWVNQSARGNSYSCYSW